MSDEAGKKLQGRFAAFGKVIDGFEEVERLAAVPTGKVVLEEVGAEIRQPIEDEHMKHMEVDTFGQIYEKPAIKYYGTV